MSNIDKDIEILKEFLTENRDWKCIECGFNCKNEVQAIENVLSELEKYKKAYELETYERQKFIEENSVLKEELKKIYKALNLEEGTIAPYTVDIIEGLKRCVTQQQTELETYKKIAEKLAYETLLQTPFSDMSNENIEILIDQVRKEVLKNE